jgi:hypothetical protein
VDTWRSGDITYCDVGDMAMECVETTSVTETWHIDKWHIDAWKSLGGTYQRQPSIKTETQYMLYLWLVYLASLGLLLGSLAKPAPTPTLGIWYPSGGGREVGS